jgi:hypothetical protein
MEVLLASFLTKIMRRKSRRERMSNRLFAAYSVGVNRTEMAKLCPTARLLGASTLKNYRLLFRGSHAAALANVESMKGRTVPVLVWEITPADEAALDRHEGFPYLYEKQSVRIRLDGNLISAMTYIMIGDRPLGKPSAFYYSAILEGYQDAGFDTRILKSAVQDSEADTPSP